MKKTLRERRESKRIKKRRVKEREDKIENKKNRKNAKNARVSAYIPSAWALYDERAPEPEITRLLSSLTAPRQAQSHFSYWSIYPPLSLFVCAVYCYLLDTDILELLLRPRGVYVKRQVDRESSLKKLMKCYSVVISVYDFAQRKMHFVFVAWSLPDASGNAVIGGVMLHI